MAPTQYRAQFDADVSFSNGGGLQARGFRVDVPGPDVTADEVAALFVASLSLLMVERVELHELQIVDEEHKGTRGGPSGPGARNDIAPDDGARTWVELSHVISAGMITYPGLPAPTITPHLTREASRQVYAHGTEFAMDVITMIGNTGTYLDSPYHRYDGGTDLAGLALSSLADLPAVVIRTLGSHARGVDVGALAGVEVAGCAVLLHTGGDPHWGTPDYARDAPILTGAGADWLVERGARLVGIDSVNIDDTASGGHRPAHSALLAAGIPIVEHLTGLDELPPFGTRFTAAPPLVQDFGTFPVRAYASIPRT
jgi:arylformamidase